MKTALCGAWHVHAEMYLKTALEYGEVAGIYEPEEKLLAPLREKYGLPVFADLNELLDSGAEGVLVCSPTNEHARQMREIASAGKHIFTEKVLALTEKDCLDVKAAVEAAGIRFVISLVHKYSGTMQTVKSVVDSGVLGKLNYFRFRNCHNGSTGGWLPEHFFRGTQCGGGAMIDLGAHGMYLADWLLGMPEAVSSAFTLSCPGGNNTESLEDNAVTVMRYADGLIALNETGFVSVGSPTALELGGETGYLRCADNVVEIRTAANGLKPETVKLLDPLPSPLVQFLTGEVLPGCGIDEAVRLTRLMELAYDGKF